MSLFKIHLRPSEVKAIKLMAFDQRRTVQAQAEQMIRESLQVAGYWLPLAIPEPQEKDTP